MYGEAERKEKIGDLVIEGDGSLSNAAGEAEKMCIRDSVISAQTGIETKGEKTARCG